MEAYYLDASAAVKGYLAERGSPRVVELLNSAAGHELYLSRVGTVEVAAGIFGKVRTGETGIEEAAEFVEMFLRDVENTYQIVEVDPITAQKAVEVCRNYLLRAYDCLQLATAVLLQEQRALAGLESMTFMSSDQELNAAARSEGLSVEDPAGS